MKSAQQNLQQLQSRISLRRNAIRRLEEAIDTRRFGVTCYKMSNSSRALRNAHYLKLDREDIKILVAEQKLDKYLYAVLLQQIRYEQEEERDFQAVCLDIYQNLYD